MSRKSFAIVLTVGMLFFPFVAFAAPPQFSELAPIIESALKLITPIGITVTSVMIVYGAYMWIMSEGDPGKLKLAQGTLTWAVIGLVFLFFANVVLKEVIDFIANQ